MGEIDPSLTKFKTTVGPSLSSMNAMGNQITNSIRTLSASTGGFQSDLDRNYNSDNKKLLISKIGEVSDIFRGISSGVESNLQGLISGSNEVLELVTELEKINGEIAAQQRIVDGNSGDSEEEENARLGAQGEINRKNREFETVHAEALRKLNSLKSSDASIVIPQASGAIDFNEAKRNSGPTEQPKESVVEQVKEEVPKVEAKPKQEKEVKKVESQPDSKKEEAPVAKKEGKPVEKVEQPKADKKEDAQKKDKSKTHDTSKDLSEYGTYELRKFKTSSGEEIEYYVYIPKNIKNVENAPAMLYLHGYNYGGYYDPSWHNQGLTGMIGNKEITPPGIVIMPHIKDHNNLAALKELTDYVVKQYKCDTDRISISGHSYGGIATYKMIDKYKDYFSCAVPISGCNDDSITSGAFEDMNVWAFGGAYEGGDLKTSTPVGQQAIERIKKVGGHGTFTVLERCEHGFSDERTYQKEYKSPTGETINPIYWAMKQVKQ